jgi:ribonucleotide reductase beta subunit family protein with ferritin-like domain
VAFICVEGILFSGSFCAIYWLKQRGLMPGLGLANEFIARDEGLHQSFGEVLYGHLKRKLPPHRVTEIVKEAVEDEKRFICEALPVSLVGMNSELMSEYIEYVADRILVNLGVPKVYNAKNPFAFMNLISLTGKTNFFERIVSEYKRAGVLTNEKAPTFSTDDAF